MPISYKNLFTTFKKSQKMNKIKLFMLLKASFLILILFMLSLKKAFFYVFLLNLVDSRRHTPYRKGLRPQSNKNSQETDDQLYQPAQIIKLEPCSSLSCKIFRQISSTDTTFRLKTISDAKLKVPTYIWVFL